MGKATRKLLRTPLVQAFERVAPDTFAGCPKGRGTDTASHAISAHLFWLTQQKRTGGIVFADIASAYYSVIKELGTGVPEDWGPMRISKLFSYTGLTPDHFQEFLSLLGTPAHGQAGISDHLNKLVIRVQECTWSVMQGCDCLAFNESGTRPGDPLADVGFAFIYE